MDVILTIFFLLLIISALVSIHEFGHFIAAKLSGVPVQEFAIGFGPSLISKKYKGTNYAIKILPIGGYVLLEGEMDTTSPNSFRNKRFRYKAFVMVSGVLMNIILAIVLLFIFLNSNGYQFALPNFTSFHFTNTDSQASYFPLIVSYIDPNGPSKGQLNEGDVVVGVDNNYFQSYTDFKNILKTEQNKTVNFEFLDRDTFNVSSRPIRVASADKNGAILEVGFSYDTQTNRPSYFIKYKPNVFSGVGMTYDLFVYQLKSLGSLVRNSFQTGNFSQVSNNVGSIPEVANQINIVVQAQAYNYLIPLTGVFSINLAMVNILPFPALDGGQLLFAFIEKIRGKKFSDKTLNTVNTIGFTFLICLSVVLIFKDVIQLNWLSGIGDFINHILGK